MASGGARLKYRLQKMTAEMEVAVGQALVEVAQKTVQSAKFLVPRDTGELANSIHHTEPHVSKRGNLVVSVVAGSKATLVKGKDGHQFQLARLVEFGTKTRPAQPFFFPAYRTNKRAAKAAIRKAIRNVLRSG